MAIPRFLLIAAAASACLLIQSVHAKDVPQVQVEELAKSSQSWDGSALPAYPAGTPEVTILRITVQPGVALPEHQHPVINAGVMLRGEITVVTEQGEQLVLNAGDSIVEVVNKWHHGFNSGTGPAEIIVFYAGIVDQPLTIKQNQDNE